MYIDKFSELKSRYIQTFEQKREELQTALAEEDMKELHSHLHKLAGSAGGYGFMQVSVLSNEIITILMAAEFQFEQQKEEIEQRLNSIYKVFTRELTKLKLSSG